MTGSPTGRRTRLARSSATAVARDWRPGGARRLAEGRWGDGERERFLIEAHDEAGYLLSHGHYGDYLVAADGSRIVAAPAAMEPWRWQRFLVGQALPLAALLHGLETLHCSAVTMNGFAVLIAGASGTGKTTLAMHLSSGQAEFLADDVAALEVSGEGVLAHPGAGVLSLDEAELGRLGGKAFGRVLGREDREARVEVPLAPAPARVGAVCFLEAGQLLDGSTVRSVRVGDPRRLIASTFNAYVQTPERLSRQLDVCSRIAATAGFFSVAAGRGRDPAELASTIARALSGSDG